MARSALATQRSPQFKYDPFSAADAIASSAGSASIFPQPVSKVAMRRRDQTAGRADGVTAAGLEDLAEEAPGPFALQ